MGQQNCRTCFLWHKSECRDVSKHAARHDHAVHARRGRRISGVFSARRVHHLITVSACTDGWIGSSWVGRRGPVEWPPRPPDLSPLDFYLCGHLKAMVYQVKIRNMNHRKERIRNAITHISPDVLTRVHHEWEKRIRMCFQSNGIHVELCCPTFLYIGTHLTDGCGGAGAVWRLQ
jgi:hypothetical protein